MSGNSIGRLFKVTTAGESHGAGLSVIIEGCPPHFELSENDIQAELDRRRPGQSQLTTDRRECDRVEILSGVFQGKTLGTPIACLFRNEDARSQDYESLKSIYRPSHADFTYQKKYGIRDHRGGGRSSARETIARVAAGAIAKKYLREKVGIDILSFVEQIGSCSTDILHHEVNFKNIESSLVRCPDKIASQNMIALIETQKKLGNSLGGMIKTLVRGVPAGLGEPVFDKLSADFAKAMMSINAVKGFEIGSGFSAVNKLGSENNDEFEMQEQNIRCKTNHAGGILGGISTGEEIYFRTAFKPVASIAQKQKTVNTQLESVEWTISGRHDVCVLPRAVPIVDAMTAIVLMDHYLRQRVNQVTAD